MKRFIAFNLALVFSLTHFTVSSFAVTDTEKTTTTSTVSREELEKSPVSRRVDEVLVVASETDANSPFLSDVEGAQIYAGKKTTRVNLSQLPEISNNNYRQALVKVPGLYLSEETTPLFSLGVRGLPPDRAQYMNVLKDGVPIHADMFGYPEAYYTPPLQTVDEIQVIRGGSALMYGPQPGGVLNYITRQPALDKKIGLHSENVFGTDGYFSTYEALTGTVGPLGYNAYFHERQGEGFRHDNSDFEVISSGLKTVVNQTGDSRLTMNYDEYHEEHGEPGGLTRQQFDIDSHVNTREFDRFRLERYYTDLKYEKDFDDAKFDFLLYGGRYRRWSKRQRGGGFGTAPTGAASSTTDIQEQDFYNLGFEPRFRKDYELFGETHVLTAGTHTFFSHSPRQEQLGSWPSADSGVLQKHSNRDQWYLSFFVENLFRWGNLTFTPGVRFENLWQRIEETFNVAKTTVPLADQREYDFVPLLGFGLTYEILKNVQIYANASEFYRPKVFADSVPLGTNQVIFNDLEEGFGWQYDLGLRGQPTDYISWDASYFVLDFDNKTGTVGNTIQNVGDMLNHGVEFVTEIDLVKAYDTWNQTKHAETIGSISPFISITLLDAQFDGGTTEGRRPQYAPQYNLRTGFSYQWQDRVNVLFSGTFLDDHFGDDANTVSATTNHNIPSYKVWDLTAELKLVRNAYDVFDLSIFGGINNIFDEHYFARITSSGIDPAYGRNIYGGVKINLG